MPARFTGRRLVRFNGNVAETQAAKFAARKQVGILKGNSFTGRQGNLHSLPGNAYKSKIPLNYPGCPEVVDDVFTCTIPILIDLSVTFKGSSIQHTTILADGIGYPRIMEESINYDGSILFSVEYSSDSMPVCIGASDRDRFVRFRVNGTLKQAEDLYGIPEVGGCYSQAVNYLATTDQEALNFIGAVPNSDGSEYFLYNVEDSKQYDAMSTVFNHSVYFDKTTQSPSGHYASVTIPIDENYHPGFVVYSSNIISADHSHTDAKYMSVLMRIRYADKYPSDEEIVEFRDLIYHVRVDFESEVNTYCIIQQFDLFANPLDNDGSFLTNFISPSDNHSVILTEHTSFYSSGNTYIKDIEGNVFFDGENWLPGNDIIPSTLRPLGPYFTFQYDKHVNYNCYIAWGYKNGGFLDDVEYWLIQTNPSGGLKSSTRLFDKDKYFFGERLHNCPPCSVFNVNDGPASLLAQAIVHKGSGIYEYEFVFGLIPISFSDCNTAFAKYLVISHSGNTLYDTGMFNNAKLNIHVPFTTVNINCGPLESINVPYIQ